MPELGKKTCFRFPPFLNFYGRWGVLAHKLFPVKEKSPPAHESQISSYDFDFFHKSGDDTHLHQKKSKVTFGGCAISRKERKKPIICKAQIPGFFFRCPAGTNIITYTDPSPSFPQEKFTFTVTKVSVTKNELKKVDFRDIPVSIFPFSNKMKMLLSFSNSHRTLGMYGRFTSVNPIKINPKKR